jgi:hypothetical protein
MSPITLAAPRLPGRGTASLCPGLPGPTNQSVSLPSKRAQKRKLPGLFLSGEFSFLLLSCQQLPPIMMVIAIRRRKRDPSQHFARLRRPNRHDVS